MWLSLACHVMVMKTEMTLIPPTALGMSLAQNVAPMSGQPSLRQEQNGT